MHTARFNPRNPLWNNTCAHGAQHAKNWLPAVEITDDGEGYILKADLPGLDKNDIEINVNDGLLVLAGERKRPQPKEKAFYRSEVTYGTFSRTFRLGAEINADGIKAEFNNGVLTITLPKAEEVKPKQIQIN